MTTKRRICALLAGLLVPVFVFCSCRTENHRTEITETIGIGSSETSGQTETASPLPEETEPAEDITGETLHDYSELLPAENQAMVIYEPNGGEIGPIFGGEPSICDVTGKIVCTVCDGFFYQTVTDSHYLCPHAMGEKGYFVRDGYVLLGYNTKADGSGEYYGCGWNVPVGKGHRTVLYAVWVQESPAEDFEISLGTLVKYNGHDETVVIPSNVKRIKQSAFDKNSELKTVILSKSVTSIGDYAFNECENLETVYMTDCVTKMNQNAFWKCDQFQTVRINNAIGIKYIGSTAKEGSYYLKFQRLLMNRNRKKMIFVSGSNAVYGLDSAYLEERLGDSYEIINYGTNHYVSTTMYLDVISHFVKEGDVVVLLPEEVPEQWGKASNEGQYAQFFHAVEGCPELISYLDIREYPVLFGQIAYHNSVRANGGNSYESVAGEGFRTNSYGDMDLDRTVPVRTFTYSEKKDWFGKLRSLCFTEENRVRFNRSLDACNAAGAKIFLSFTVVDESYISDSSAETVSAYEADAEAFCITGFENRYRISHQADYIFPHEYFYNSMHHLLSVPARTRTEMLADDIQTALDAIP